MDNQNETKNIPQKKSKKLLIAGGILVLLIAVGGVVYSGIQGGWFKGYLTGITIQGPSTTTQTATTLGPINATLVVSDKLYVYKDTPARGPDSADEYEARSSTDGSIAYPYVRIQTAINKLKAAGKTGGAIYVAKGTYSENVSMDAFTGIQLLGGYDAGFTTENPVTNETVISGKIDGLNIGGKISGFTFKNLTSPYAIYISNLQTAKNITVSDNRFNDSHVTTNYINIKSMAGGKGTISNNTFYKALSDKTLIEGSSAGGETIIEKNFIKQSGAVTSGTNGMINAYTGTTVRNNLILSSYSTAWVGISVIDAAEIYNNTIALNSFKTAAIASAGTGAKIYNNLVYNQKVGSAFLLSSATDDQHNSAYNDGEYFQQDAASVNFDNTYNCSPLFVSSGSQNAEDYKLKSTSICKDAGMTVSTVKTDYFGTTRPQGAAYDIGFAEFSAPQVCGNGVKEGTEKCDDGNTTSGDGCSSTCNIEMADLCSNITGTQTIVPLGYKQEGTLCIKCGDNKKEGSEACDDGNTTSGDGCSATCTQETDICTNITGFQLTLPAGYSQQGTLCVKCGDGNKEGSETCDDGNTTSGDGCNATCTLVETDVCTNLTGFQLTVPTGYVAVGTICNQTTQPAVCGNGSLEAGEQCDDGNTSNLDACTANCKTAYCGDNYKRTGVEACDDGNNTNGDGCSSSCQTEAIVAADCGNGTKESGEQCDDGNGSNTDGCLNNCKLPVCGDGKVWTNNEECDDGNTVSGDGCSASCHDEEVTVTTEEPVCGEWPDVSKTDPEYGIWVWECQRGILRGYDNGKLGIDNNLTRAELLAIAFRARAYESLGEVDFEAENCFNDGRGEWYEPYSCTGKDEGFIVGYEGNVFKGGNNVILAEGLKMFLGALNKPYTTSSDPWYYDMVWDAHLNNGLPYSLRDQNDVVPVGTIELTRRRAINMLYRLQIM